MAFKIKTLFYKIGYRAIKDDCLLFENKTNASKFSFLKAPAFHWAADPFIFEYNGKNYLFAEVANIFSNKGDLRCVCLEDKRKKWIRVMKHKTHLSFPNIFVYKNDILLIPETNEKKSIICYSCSSFPNKWIKKQIIFSGDNFVDTIFNGSVIFSYVEGKGLYCIKNPFENGTVIEIFDDKTKTLRPAGNPFFYKNDYFYVFQNNSIHYGGGLLFCTIKDGHFYQHDGYSITEEAMQENGISSCKGIHTYNHNQKFEVIDILYKRFSLLSICGIIYRKLFKRQKKDDQERKK